VTSMFSASSGASPQRLLIAFAAGFLAVLLFHQPVLWLLASAGITQALPYSAKAVGPLGVPQFVSAAFWGGLWGIALYLVSRRWSTGASYWLKVFLFGMIFPTLGAWFIVAPLKGLPVAAGGQWNGMLTGLCVNAAWGLGTALLMRMANLRPGH
jgi:hypothetical protein